MSTEYKDIISNSPELLARHHTITDRLAAKVREDFGVEISKEELSDLSSVRVTVLSGDETLLATFDAEIERHPGVTAAKKERALLQALSDKKDPAHDAAREAFDKLSPQAKITRARELDAAKPAAEKRPELTDAERKAALRDIKNLRGSAKIAAARKAGIAL